MSTRATNVAGRVAAAFIDNRLTVLIVVLSLAAGLLAFFATPREENPQIVVPAANILVSKPGASPEEVEQLIVKPLEAILQGMSGVEHTYGMAMDSLGVVSVQFYVGEDKEDALVKLYDRIMSNIDRMPPGTGQPLVKPVDVDDVPILTIALSSDTLDDAALRTVALDVLEHLRRVEDTSVAFVHGGRPRQINVGLDLERMRHFNVTLADIRHVLEATNVDFASGFMVQNNREAIVHAGAFLQRAQDVGDLVVGLQQHRPVFLRDVADVRDGPGEIDTLTRIGFGPAHAGERFADLETPAVTIAIAKRPGANAVRVAARVLAALEDVRPTLIPAAVQVHVTRDDGARADDAVGTLMEHLAIAIATVVALLVVFLGWRAAGIVTITIPLILFITLVVGMVAGQSINRITLFALILSLGLLVDDSIVVIENIYRHYAAGARNRLEDAVAAVNEIGRPTNLATLTVILAFAPMAWVTGMMGPYMGPIPFNVPVAMITSLLIAYTVAPWAAYRWLKVAPGAHHAEGEGWLAAGYGRLLQGLLDRTWVQWVFFAAVAALMGAVMLLAVPGLGPVAFKMLPKNDTNTFNITVDMPEGTALEHTDLVARQVADIVRAHPQVRSIETTVGRSGVVDFNGLLRGADLRSGPHVADVRVNLRDKHDRAVSSIDIVRDLRPAVAQLAREQGASIKLVEDPPGPPVRATVLAELYGPDYERLRELALALRSQVFATTHDMVDIDDSVTAERTEYRIEVDREKAALAGILPVQVAETLHTFLAGYDVSTVHVPGTKEPVPIRFRIPARDRVEPADLQRVFFTNPQGRQVSLAEIAQIRRTVAPKPILHKDQRPVVYVTGELDSTSQVYAVWRMYRYLGEHALPPDVHLTQYFLGAPGATGYSVRWDGEMRLTLDVFRDLGAAFAVAIVLIYLVLVGYYGSFAVPLIVMGAIPLTIVGVLPGHAIMGQAFTATSMIGVIALAGVVVRNSLLLIDFILDYRRAGHPVAAAVVRAGQVRVRPILLTALAIILGTLVMIFDPVFGGLAISLIFGTFASTVLTLVVIPLIYYLYARKTG